MGHDRKEIWRIVCAICHHDRRRFEYEKPETCSKLCAQELRRRRMMGTQRPTMVERQKLTEACLSQKGELCCQTCGGALWNDVERTAGYSGRSIWGCTACGYTHFTDLYVGARRHPKTVTPHKRPSYHKGQAA